MRSTISVAAKPCVIEANGKILLREYCIMSSSSSCTRAEVTVAPKQSGGMRVFPELSKLADLRIQEVVKRQTPIHNLVRQDHACRKPQFHPTFLREAYERCRKICEEYAKSFYLGFSLLFSTFPPPFLILPILFLFMQPSTKQLINSLRMKILMNCYD